APQGRKIELGGGQERARIDPSAVRGIEHDRTAAFGGIENLERGVEFGLHETVHRDPGAFPAFWRVYRTFPCDCGSAKIVAGLHPIFTGYPAYGVVKFAGHAAVP